MENNLSPDEIINDEDNSSDDGNDGDIESIEDLKSALAKERAEKANLQIALKKTREKAKQSDGGSQDDIDARVEKVLEENKLKEKYNGENGLPKFDKKELVEYAKEVGLEYDKINPETLYKLKYQSEITENSIKGALRANKGVVTLEGKPVSVATAKKRLESATSPQEIDEIMNGVQ